MAVVLAADPLDIELDRIAEIASGRDVFDDPRLRSLTLMHLWLNVYSTARDRGGVSLYPPDTSPASGPLHRLAAIAAAEFFYYHALHESLTAPPPESPP